MSTARRWTLLIIVAGGLLLVALDNSVLYTALPTLTREIGATTSESLWIINAYPVVMAGLLLGSGTLGDRIGHRRMFLIGLTLFGFASLAAAFSPTPELLIASRAALAVGAAAMMPATLALVRITFEIDRERNIAIAVWGSISIVGSGLGPIVGGLLLEHFWWGSVFLINVPIVALAIVGALILAPRDTGNPDAKWDLVSSLFALVALVGLVFAIKELARAHASIPMIVAAVVVVVVASVFFARRQRRLVRPMVDFAIFRNPAFVAGLLAALFAMFAVGGIQLVTTQRFQLVSDFTPLEAGLLVAAVAVGTLPSGLVGGAILHRTGLLPLIAGGFAIGSVGVVMALLTFDTNLGWFITALLITGFGLGSTFSVASTAIMSSVSAARAGMASSIEEVSYEFGSLVAVALLGSLISAIYTMNVVLPDGAPATARDGLERALEDAHAGAAPDTALISAASMAYDSGYLIVMIVIASVMVASTVITAILLRRHGPGSRIHVMSH